MSAKHLSLKLYSASLLSQQELAKRQGMNVP